ncbi:hypothetical protein HYY72_05655 [Candidatus Woesearchaeota archaeon]|nr:hypothetical protein [Candidatus Woesearchaeota archaeon]
MAGINNTMGRLPNAIELLGEAYAPPDWELSRGNARVVFLSDMTAAAGTRSGEGRLWEDYLQDDYHVLLKAVDEGILKPGAAVHPDNLREILVDPTEWETYTAGIAYVNNEPVAAIHPELNYAGRGKRNPFVLLHYNVVAVNSRVKLALKNGESIERALFSRAVQRVNPSPEAEIPVFSDDKNSIGLEGMVRLYGFRAILPQPVGVPSLDADGILYGRRADEAYLMLKNDKGTIPLPQAIRIVRAYFAKGYGTSEYKNPLLRDAISQLENAAVNGMVPLTEPARSS